MMIDEQMVLAANLSFYEAFANHDLAAMDALWSHRHPVACVHPGWHVIHGRDEVMESWRAILTGPRAPVIRCRDAHAVIVEEVAFVTCVEQVGGSLLAATNIFARESGVWRLVHHQAGPCAEREAASPRTPTPPKDSLN
jgi:hypothetical protein